MCVCVCVYSTVHVCTEHHGSCSNIHTYILLYSNIQISMTVLYSKCLNTECVFKYTDYCIRMWVCVYSTVHVCTVSEHHGPCSNTYKYYCIRIFEYLWQYCIRNIVCVYCVLMYMCALYSNTVHMHSNTECMLNDVREHILIK